MNKQNLPNVLSPHGVGQCDFCEQRLPFESNQRRWVARVLSRVLRGVRKIGRQQAIEVENRKAIKHLQSLTDEHLRDIGIARFDISRAVWFGKDGL